MANEFVARNGIIAQDNSTITGSLTVTNGITGSIQGTATTASYVATASYAILAATASSADNLTVRGTLTAQTLVVQTITSSVAEITGSTQFGSILSNTHQFTGSVSISGSSRALIVNSGSGFSYVGAVDIKSLGSAGLTVNGEVNIANGVYVDPYGGVAYDLKMGGSGNAIATKGRVSFDNGKVQTNGSGGLAVTGSLSVSGSSVFSGSVTSTNGFTGSLSGTSSYATSALTASHALTAPYSGLQGTVPTWDQNTTGTAATASYVLQAVSASFASTASSADNFTVRGTLTAQTINVQTITSSIEFNTGSTRNGSTTANTHEFTGSLFQTGSTAAFMGSVGVGTLTPPNKLSVVTGTGADDILPALGANGGKFSLLNNGGLYGLISGVLGTGTTYIQSQRVDGTATAYNLLLNPNGGNVGVGTTVPSYSLDVQTTTAQLQVRSTTGTNFSIVRINNTGGDMYVGRENSAGGNLATGTTAYAGVINVQGTAPLQFAVNNAIGLTILNGGNIGIGKTTANSKLDVNGNTTVTGSLNVNGSITSTGTITAQTLVVQTITSSTDFVTGSSRFGSTTSNTHQFTGSLFVSGSTVAASLRGSGSAVFSVDGTSGRLFSVDDSLTGSLFSVNTSAGLPVIEAFSDNTVRIGQFGQRTFFVSQSAVGVGIENPTAKLHISGSSGVLFEIDSNAQQNILYVTSSGNIGIRKTAPNAPLDISGSVLITGSLNITGSITITSGSITMPNRPAFRVVGTGGAINAVTVLSGSKVSVDFNQGNHFNTTTGLFTAPIAGLYQVNIVMRTDSNTNSTINQVIVYKSGSNTGGNLAQIMVEFGTNTSMNHAGGSTISKLEVGDTLKAVIAVGTCSFDGNDNFSVAYIG